MIFDYDKCYEKLKGNDNHKNRMLKMILAILYTNSVNKIVTLNDNNEYVESLRIFSELYMNSKSLQSKNYSSLLVNGKKNNYFAYQYSYRNDYYILFMHFDDNEDDKFDIPMQYYGYYKLIYDADNNRGDDNLLFTRSKKIQDKSLALKIGLKPYQLAIYKRIRDI